MKTRMLIVVLAALMLSSFGCSSQTTLSRIEKNGKLVLGTSADYPPYEFVIMQDGRATIVGFDIEIARQLASDIGEHLGRTVTLDIQDIGFDGLLQALNSDRVDIVIAGMTPSEERAKSVDFSDIYYVAQQGIMVRTEDVERFTSLESLAGRTVGAQLSTIQEELVTEELPDSRLVSLGRIPDLMLELKNGMIDALVVELPVAEGYARANADLVITDIAIGDAEGGSAVAIKKGNDDLVNLINQSLQRMIADGTIDRFVAEANELVVNN
ncbi:ABC transporter substrate-binding protein [Spirochaeta dissipatitropha]